MKTIGLIGGMSWESSIEYYRIINEAVHQRLGGVHSAKSLMYSVDFGEVEALQHQGRWAEATELMIDAARRVQTGGADFTVICTNTMHKMAEEVQQALNIPLLHIADATGERVAAQHLRRVGLLGTRFTMEEKFYRGRLAIVSQPSQATVQRMYCIIRQRDDAVGKNNSLCRLGTGVPLRIQIVFAPNLRSVRRSSASVMTSPRNHSWGFY